MLVTGASRGLGAALGRELLARGHRVVLTARNRAELAQAVDSLRAQHGDCVGWIAADLSDPSAAQTLVAQVEQRFGPLDGASTTLASVPGSPESAAVYLAAALDESNRVYINPTNNKAQPCGLGSVPDFLGAGEKSRTPDLRITNALLYQLSYTGVQLSILAQPCSVKAQPLTST